MVRALALSLLLTQASKSQGSCEGGVCDAGRESSVLMQRKNRNKQIPLRQAAQAATEQNGPVDLFQATAQLLRVGASPDVIQFTNDTLEALETDIIPSLIHGFDEDSAMVNESFARVEEVLARWEESKGSLQPLRQAEADAIAEHHSCRQQEQNACEQHETCHESCHSYNETYITTETEYLAITEVIHHRWCEVYGNKSDPVWRTSISEKFSRYLTLGEKRIEEKRQLTHCVTECETKTWRSQVEADLLQVHGKTAQVSVDHEGEGHKAMVEAETSWNPCDEKQRAMEHASCSLMSHREHLNQMVASEWHLTTSSFADVVSNVKTREELRHKDFKALAGIKCLLKHIVDRAGKPCDEEEEPGVADTLIDECDTYWQVDVHMLLMPWNITYPELPEAPEPVPSTPHPCTGEWAQEQYGWLSGKCFSSMPACQACPTIPHEEPTLCCMAHSAECLACANHQSVEEYCQEHPTTGGCEIPPTCCKAYNAECLACAHQMTVEQYCEEYPSIAGCEEHLPPTCCRAYNAQCLACTHQVSEEEYCQEHPEVAGCEVHRPLVQR